jgi:hypothetical protein
VNGIRQPPEATRVGLIDYEEKKEEEEKKMSRLPYLFIYSECQIRMHHFLQRAVIHIISDS